MSSFLWSTTTPNKILDDALEEIVKNTANLNVEQCNSDKETQVGTDHDQSVSSDDNNESADDNNESADDNNESEDDNNESEDDNNESENEDFDTESVASIDTDSNKNIYVISVNGRPLYYNDNTLDARRLMWSVARRITQNLFLTGNYNVRISPETDDKLKVFSVSKFAIFSYERLEHTITCKKSVQASVLKN
jgi:hypothetical protein